MNGLPLHPMVVHFPIVLQILVPIAATIVAVIMSRKLASQKLWFIPLLLQAAVFISAFAAVQLGERDEDKVERIVTEQVLEHHEEQGERFLTASGVLMVLMILPIFLKSRLLPILLTLISLVPAGMVVPLGHSGGELVYKHGAARAHTQSNQPLGSTHESPEGHDNHDDD